MISDAQAEFIAYKTNQIDVSYSINYSDVPEIRRDLAEHLEIWPYIGTYDVLFNTRRAPFDDVRIRRAFSLGFDRARLTREVTEDIRRPAFSWVPPGIKDADGVTDFVTVSGHVIPDDAAEEAQRLLAEAGYPNGEGFPTVQYLYNTGETHRQIAERLKADWERVLNVHVELVNQESQVHSANVDSGNFQMTRSSWFGDYSDPMTFLDMWMTGNGNNRSDYSNPEYDALVTVAQHTVDRGEYFRLCHEAERMILDNGVIAPVMFYSNEFLKNPALEGMIATPEGGLYFHHAHWNHERLREASVEASP
jgi:oligopeptide transport system substrate-binding protein